MSQPISPETPLPTPLHGTRNIEHETDPLASHPTELGVLDGVTVSLGIVGGAVTGMTAGIIGGPAGMAAGALIGGVAGGFAGKEAGKFLDPTTDESWIKQEFAKRPYLNPDETYEEYAPSYRYGAKAEAAHAGHAFSEVEDAVKREYELSDRNAILSWGRAKPAVNYSFNRLSELRKERAAVSKP